MSSSLEPKKNANCAIIDASDAKKLAMVMISTSRFFTCVSSCAITPSSSVGLSVFMIPVVAHTTALFFERPIANAFGIGVSATAIFGLGRSAWMQSFSIIAWSPGACSGVTCFAPMEASAILSERKSCASSRPAQNTTMIPTPAPSEKSTAEKATYSSPIRNSVVSIRN